MKSDPWFKVLAPSDERKSCKMLGASSGKGGRMWMYHHKFKRVQLHVQIHSETQSKEPLHEDLLPASSCILPEPSFWNIHEQREHSHSDLAVFNSLMMASPSNNTFIILILHKCILWFYKTPFCVHRQILCTSTSLFFFRNCGWCIVW